MIATAFDEQMNAIIHDAVSGNAQFEQLMAVFQAGVMPDKDKARQVANELARQSTRFKAFIDGLENSNDFQSQEAYHALDLMAKRHKVPSLRGVQQFVQWQADGLFAFVDTRPLPPLPAGIDPDTVGGEEGTTGPGITASTTNRELPFDEDSFDDAPSEEGELLKTRFLQLVKDHDQLVGLGETYGDFDPAGKEFYLGQMSQIMFRWDELIDEALEAGVSVTPSFKSNSVGYLRQARLDGDGFRDVMDGVISKMRELVNKEKGIGA